MLGKFFECEANRNDKYYRVIQTEKEYSDGRRFPIDEIVIADNKVNLNAEDRTKMGGFCISSYEYIFRWLIRGDTLCEDKVNSQNVEIAIKEFEDFCKRRKEEKYVENLLEIENEKVLYEKMIKIKF